MFVKVANDVCFPLLSVFLLVSNVSIDLGVDEDIPFAVNLSNS